MRTAGPDLLDTVQNYPEHSVVINAAARTKTSTARYGDIMQEALAPENLSNASCLSQPVLLSVIPCCPVRYIAGV